MSKNSKITIRDELIRKRIIFLHHAVVDFGIEDIIGIMVYLNTLNSKPITLNICSPGGSVDHGLALYDFIKTSKAPVHTHCSGLAASMGAILLAAGKKGKRTASKNSRIMIHQPSGGYIGKASDIEVHANETSRIKKLLSQLVADDTGKSIHKVIKDMNQDLWMTAAEAKSYGLIDKIV